MFRRAKEGSGRGTTSRSCYYRGSGLVQLQFMLTWGENCPGLPQLFRRRRFCSAIRGGADRVGIEPIDFFKSAPGGLMNSFGCVELPETVFD